MGVTEVAGVLELRIGEPGTGDGPGTPPGHKVPEGKRGRGLQLIGGDG